ncbi:MAG: rhodanese-like domain-containing protein [Phycisphaerales bacterium]|nr:rhodanese-like domain-containing protein [Phycisphaerales bacterium]
MGHIRTDTQDSLTAVLRGSLRGTLAGIVCVLAACEVSTSDRDLVYLDAYHVMAAMNKPGGVFQSGKTSAFIDPRSRAHYAQKHIAGAISLPFEDMTLEAPGLLEKYDIMCVYDTDYDDILAKAASKRLLELGFKTVYTLEGGLKAWEKAGNEVQTGIPADAPQLPDKPVM